jgi:small nuclear ribonucleoprotein (snRNP)-like protein
MEGTVERKYLGHYFSEQMVGVMIIRGENVVLLGEIVRQILFKL